MVGSEPCRSSSLADAGVLLVLALVYFLYLERTALSPGMQWVAGGLLLAGDPGPVGRILSSPRARRGGQQLGRYLAHPVRRGGDRGRGGPARPRAAHRCSYERRPADIMTAQHSGRVLQLRVVVEADDFEEAVRFYHDTLGLPEQAAIASGGEARS